MPIKVKKWKGGNLSGKWVATEKMDGVRAINKNGRVVSRKGKPLFNLDHLKHLFTDAEIFCGSLKATIQKVRASKQKRPVLRSEIYSLAPPDKRIILREMLNPTKQTIHTLARLVMSRGGEGLVLRQGDVWLKVVGKRSYDVRVTGVRPGTGKHKGRMGALMTTKGRVGTGFSDAQRKEFNTPKMIGVLIEASCKQLTPGGKFRHASFERVRWDKPGGKDFKGDRQ